MCHRKFFCLILICFVGLSFGCMAAAPPEESVADVSTVAATRIPAMATSSATPSLTPMPTSTAMPTPTVHLTATETPFAIPTPPGSEQVLWLYETNNGCLLPCWWGITPGKTSWSTAQEFLRRFDSDIYQASSTPGRTYYGIQVFLPSKVFAEPYMELGILVQNNIVERIETDVSIGDTPPGYLTQYNLSSFLSTYGQPSEVWLSTYSSHFEDLPFIMVLFYLDQGIAALYGVNGLRQGDEIHGCLQEDPVGVLELWSPNTDFTFEQLVSSSSAFNREYLPLEASTEMNVAAFYETFKNPDNTTCLKTAADLWP